MKFFFILTSIVASLFAFNLSSIYAQNKGHWQFPIFENGKYGSINDKGQVIIQLDRNGKEIFRHRFTEHQSIGTPTKSQNKKSCSS